MSKSTYSPILPYIYDFATSKKNKGIAILDYGCGDGTILEYFSELKLNRFDGLDINKSSIVYGNKKYKKDPKIKFHYIKETGFPKVVLQRKYDVVIVLGVLPYMSEKEIELFFKLSHKVLNKKGILVGYSRSDYWQYTFTDLYKFILPLTIISNKKLIEIAAKTGFKQVFKKEMGLLIAPLFNNTFMLGFDALDKILFRTKGTLGPFGRNARRLVAPLIDLEQSIPLDYGYKMYFVFQKK